MPPKKLRQYEPLWEALKKHRSVTIVAPIHKHHTIIRMVSKEKWQDTAFKEKEGWRMLWLSYVIHGNEITFTLSYKATELLPRDF